MGGLRPFPGGMNEDGKRRLSRREIRKRPEICLVGVGVLPGRYKCVVYYNNLVDSTCAHGQNRPRIFFDEDKAKAKNKLQKI